MADSRPDRVERVKVRRAGVADAQAFHFVMLEAGRAGMDPRSSWHRTSLEDVQYGLAHHGGFVAQQAEAVGAEIVGVVGHRPYGEFLTLNKLAVLPAWQGRGVARRLVSAVEQEARARGFGRVLLAVSQLNLAVVPLYQKLGYAVDASARYPFAAPDSPPPVVLTRALEVRA